MPEPVKLEPELENGALPGAEDGGAAVASTENKHAPEDAGSEPVLQAASIAPETVTETSGQGASDAPEHQFGDFAQDVISVLDGPPSGLEEPGTQFELGAAAFGTGFMADDDLTDEAFFAGWDGLDILHEEELAAGDVAEDALVFQNGIAAEALPSLENLARSGPDLALLDKHDALAEAVQSALQSVYGADRQPAVPEDSGQETEPRVIHGAAARTRVKPDAVVQGAPIIDDGLSPQDIILGFFNYKSSSTDAIPPSGGVMPEEDEDAADPSFISRFGPVRTAPSPVSGDVYESPLFRSPANRPPRPSARDDAGYDGPASFPVPVFTGAERVFAERGGDNGRLLGVAGIGLIGGIAIAAALAVFMLDSYAPEQQNAAIPPANQTDASPPIVASATPEASSEISASDVAGMPGQALALSLSVKTPQPLEETLISISGVPHGARLSSGVDAGNGNWLLPPQRLAGLMLSLPDGFHDGFPLEVQLVDINAKTALSAKKKFAITLSTGGVAPVEASLAGPPVPAQDAVLPVAPVPPVKSGSAFTTQTVTSPPSLDTPFKTQTAPSGPAESPVVAGTGGASITELARPLVNNQQGKLSRQPEIEDLIREGNKRMREGDIMQARDFYLKAINMGDAEAALAMGRSYDPIYFDRLDKKNAEADAAKAFEWYRKAMDAGASQTARVRIDNLKRYLNE